MPETLPGITILIATHNRAEVLRTTLDALTRLDCGGLDASIVVVDNNSTDVTAKVIGEYQNRLPLIVLTESRPGKNCALNKALRECSLKDVVVFADDDITPSPDWLQQIHASTVKWSRHSIFGGPIEVLWPPSGQPPWVANDWMKVFGFGFHKYSDRETVYQAPACPFGANFWVRKSVFQRIGVFDETIGPRPTNRIMGSETALLMRLQRGGFQIVYYPQALVQHRITEKQCQVSALRRRGYTFGRGQVRLHGWHRSELYVKSKLLWFARMLVDYVYTGSRFALGKLLWNPRWNCELTVSAMIRLGKLNETFAQMWANSPPPDVQASPLDALETADEVDSYVESGTGVTS